MLLFYLEKCTQKNAFFKKKINVAGYLENNYLFDVKTMEKQYIFWYPKAHIFLSS